MNIFGCFIVSIIYLSLLFNGSTVYGENLTCYQCTKNEDEKCELEFLLPCPAKFDRCAMHITKYASTGFQIKRECGLGPCDFNDLLMNNNLGMKCDRSKQEYSCLSCCKGNGCNNNSDKRSKISWTLFMMVVLMISLQIVKNYQPPYVFNYDLT
nr:uncharacterized protein LOC111429233 [Onthophagus taurus]